MKRGFTFVELLIAATMISVLFVGLGTHLRGGLEVWGRAKGVGQALQEQRVALQRIERDLANAFVYDDTRADVPAGLTQLTAGELRWFTRLRGPSSTTVQVVTYWCEAVEGEPWLLRRGQSISQARAGLLPEPERLLPGCRLLATKFAYLPADETPPVTLGWRSMWPDDPQAAFKLPRLVELTVELGDDRRLRRVIGIPAGKFGKPEG